MRVYLFLYRKHYISGAYTIRYAIYSDVLLHTTINCSIMDNKHKKYRSVGNDL